MQGKLKTPTGGGLKVKLAERQRKGCRACDKPATHYVFNWDDLAVGVYCLADAELQVSNNYDCVAIKPRDSIDSDLVEPPWWSPKAKLD